ncbi:MAG: hypothetical protein M3P98_01000 [bacterium]|nr:hypothetical protein [bacterium]
MKYILLLSILLALTSCKKDEPEYVFVWKTHNQVYTGTSGQNAVRLGTILIPCDGDTYENSTDLLNHINTALAGKKKLVLGEDGYIYGEADQDYGELRCMYQSWQTIWKIKMDTL